MLDRLLGMVGLLVVGAVAFVMASLGAVLALIVLCIVIPVGMLYVATEYVRYVRVSKKLRGFLDMVKNPWKLG